MTKNPRLNNRVSFLISGILLIFIVILILMQPSRSPEYPDEMKLNSEFSSKRVVFEKLRVMAQEDGSLPFSLNETQSYGKRISLTRLGKYRQLLNDLGSKVTLLVNSGHVVKFIYSKGGSSFAFGPQWSNGILYVPIEPNHLGTIVRTNGDINLKEENIFLIPVESHWCMFHEQD